jgi:hypothetical protein
MTQCLKLQKEERRSSLVRALLGGVLIPWGVFGSFFFLMGARFGYVDPFNLILCFLVVIPLCIPYGIGAVVLAVVRWRWKNAVLTWTMTPFVYGGITGGILVFSEKNPRMFSYHEQPWVDPSLLEIVVGGIELGFQCALVGALAYVLISGARKVISAMHRS